MGDYDFLIITLKSDRIRKYFNRGWYLESLYLLAMVDYLCRENDIPLCNKYNDMRQMKLAEPIYPLSVNMAAYVTKNEQWKEDSIRNGYT